MDVEVERLATNDKNGEASQAIGSRPPTSPPTRVGGKMRSNRSTLEEKKRFWLAGIENKAVCIFFPDDTLLVKQGKVGSSGN